MFAGARKIDTPIMIPAMMLITSHIPKDGAAESGFADDGAMLK
jgi:hypothetical protein